MKSLIRWILPVLLGVNGVAMLAVPLDWYNAVPGATGTGPFNPHFVRDIGAAYIASAVGIGWWAARKGIGGAVVALVFLGLHAIVHLAEAVLGHHPGSDIGRDFVGVTLPALITLWIVWRGR